MLRVEEARRSALRERSAGHPGLHAGKRVAAAGQGVADPADLLGAAHRGHRPLRGLVGVERGLVVQPRRLVEGVVRHLGVEALELLAQHGDVLVGERARGLELLPLLARELAATTPSAPAASAQCTARGGQRRDHQPHHARRGQRQERQARPRGPVGRPHQPRPLPVPEQHPVERHRGRDQPRRDDRPGQDREKRDLLDGVDVLEPLAERQRQQEARQDLDAGLGDPQLLQQLVEVSVVSRPVARLLSSPGPRPPIRG